jgi:hypothetical protein
MGSKAKSGGGRKIGKQKKKASQVRYTGVRRWTINQMRKMRKHFRESGMKDGQCYALLQSKYDSKGIANLTDPRPAAEEAKAQFERVRARRAPARKEVSV